MTFDNIVKRTQGELKKALITELIAMGYTPKSRDGFLYAEGSIPVMLVAHMDTVHKTPVKTICASADGQIIMSPEGIGGDDRAGVYMILQIIKQHRCHVLFCEDEEIGAIGAGEFVKSDIYPDINYIVELDRRGSNDAVFYDCDNPEFTQFVESFGFEEEIGSFSDISIIAPRLGVAAVNISAGYFCEHSLHEYVDMRIVHNNIERVSMMVAEVSPHFAYMEAQAYGYDIASAYLPSPDAEIKPLMMLPESAYIRNCDHEMEECFGQYYIDDTGKVYEYLDSVDLVIEADGCCAFNESGLPAQFDEQNAAEYEIVSEDYAYSVMEWMDYRDSIY